MCITVATVLLLLCVAMPFLGSDNSLVFMIKVALLGLACITLSLLSVFLMASVVETYPHTVRALAMCLFFGCFLLGRSLESIAEYLVNQERVLEELFAECAFILLLHMVAMR